MKYLNYLRFLPLAIILSSAQVFAGPLYDALRPLFNLNSIPPTFVKAYEKTRVHEDFKLPAESYGLVLKSDEEGPYLEVPFIKAQSNRMISDEDLQNKLRETATTLIRDEITKINQTEDWTKKVLLNKLYRINSLILDLRELLSPVQKKVDITDQQNAILLRYGNGTEELYKHFLTLSSTIFAKQSDADITDDNNFKDLYPVLKNVLSDFLNATITSLEINEPFDNLVPFYVYNLLENPKLLPALINTSPALINTSSHLEQKLKETLQLIKDAEFLQQNLRSESQFFFTEQKRIITQMKEQFSNMLQYYVQKEGITEEINYRKQEVVYTSSNPMEAIEKKSLKDIFNELDLNRNSLIAQLDTISKNIQFAAQNILPYTIEEFYIPLDFNQPTKQNNYYKLLMNTGTTLSANALALIEVLADGDRFAMVNPAHLTFYWNLLKNLEGLFGSYEKYLGIPIDDDSQQNPPLFVHIRNL
ncbi:MAG: hypothetical protein Q8S31_05015 [Alphaproteobacteria bacterium]|nr:hypothetical protein [Alphaproteobacteria bacterium]